MSYLPAVCSFCLYCNDAAALKGGRVCIRLPKLLECLHRATCTAHAAVLFVCHDFKDSRKADEDVHECFDNRPRAEEHVDEVPTTSHEAAQSDKPPVETSDNDENPAHHVH